MLQPEMLRFRHIRPRDLKSRKEYSEKFKTFERVFSYPLGDGAFFISHGLAPEADYFTFFEQLGDVHFVVAEKGHEIVGAICVVLREMAPGFKIWYLCDFKIEKKYRGKGLTRSMLLRYFLKFYFKRGAFFAINMSPPSKNKLVAYTQKIFSMLKVRAEPKYLYSLNREQTLRVLGLYPGRYRLVSNIGKKDLIVNNELLPTYHLIPIEHPISIKDCSIEGVSENSMIFLMIDNAIEDLPAPQQVSFITNSKIQFYTSSAEI